MKQLARDIEFLNFRNLKQILSHDVFIYGTGETCLEFLEFLDAHDLSILVSSFIDTFKSGAFDFTGKSIPIRAPSHLEGKDADLIITSIYFLEMLDHIPTTFSGRVFVLSNELIHAASPLSQLTPFHIETTEQDQARRNFEQIKWAKSSRDMAELYFELRLGMQEREFLDGWLEISTRSYVPERIDELILGGKSEILLIGGVFDGEQIFELTKTLDSNTKIIGVDLDLGLVPKKRLELLSEYPNLTLIESALSSHVGTLEFFGYSNSSSQVVPSAPAGDNKLIQVPATTVDNLLEEIAARSIGIFLDIEGSEREAILGMAKTFNREMVGLEFASYHRNKDLFELPILVNNLTKNESEFYFRAIYPTFIDSNILVEVFNESSTSSI